MTEEEYYEQPKKGIRELVPGDEIVWLDGSTSTVVTAAVRTGILKDRWETQEVLLVHCVEGDYHFPLSPLYKVRVKEITPVTHQAYPQ